MTDFHVMPCKDAEKCTSALRLAQVTSDLDAALSEYRMTNLNQHEIGEVHQRIKRLEAEQAAALAEYRSQK